MEKARRTQKNQDLSRALGENVEENFEKLIRMFQNRLYSFSLRLTNNRADAEDIVQEGLVRAFRALKSYAPRRIEAIDLGPWLYRIVLNVFRTRGRKAPLRGFSLDDSHRALGQSAENLMEPGPDEGAEKAQIRDRLEQAIISLPDRYRIPVVLRYGEGAAYSKIKDILKQPEGTVKSNVHRGIQLLRENFLKMKRSKR